MRYLIFGLLIATFALFTAEALAAEASAPAASTVPESSITEAAAKSDAEPPAETDDSDSQSAAAKPTDTLGGSGLKNRQLGDIFEQFVPTETISADNAVPFPVDI